MLGFEEAMIFGKDSAIARNHIDVPLERLWAIILLARAHEADLVALDASDSYDDAGGGTSTPEQDPSERDLRTAIAALPADEQAVLVALVWIGRGDFSPQDFDTALTQAFDRSGPPTSDYLLSLAPLADSLLKGAAVCGADLDGQGGPGQRNGKLH